MSDAPPPSSGGAPGDSPGSLIEDAEPMSLGRRTARILAVVVGLFILVMWVYALWIPKDTTPPGTLDDDAFPLAAQPICSDAAAAIADLPPAYDSPEAGARAEVIAEATGHLDTMVVRLREIAPTAESGNDGRMVQEWLGDWETYLGDRERYVDALVDDPDARFLVSEKEGRQVTEPIDFFATYNEMSNCVTPGDLA